jgi:hypothetical protein
VKAGLAAGEESPVESPPDGDDLSQDRQRDLLRRLGAKRQTHRTAHAVQGSGVRLVSRCPQRRQKPAIARSGPEQPDVGSVGVEREAQALAIPLEMMVHDDDEGAGVDRHRLRELTVVGGDELRTGEALRREKRFANVHHGHCQSERPALVDEG